MLAYPAGVNAPAHIFLRSVWGILSRTNRSASANMRPRRYIFVLSNASADAYTGVLASCELIETISGA